MSIVAHNLQMISQMRNEARKMEHNNFNENILNDYLSDELKIAGTMIKTAQVTLSDLDRSILELADLVDTLRYQSKKLKNSIW